MGNDRNMNANDSDPPTPVSDINHNPLLSSSDDENEKDIKNNNNNNDRRRDSLKNIQNKRLSKFKKNSIIDPALALLSDDIALQFGDNNNNNNNNKEKQAITAVHTPSSYDSQQQISQKKQIKENISPKMELEESLDAEQENNNNAIINNNNNDLFGHVASPSSRLLFGDNNQKEKNDPFAPAPSAQLLFGDDINNEKKQKEKEKKNDNDDDPFSSIEAEFKALASSLDDIGNDNDDDDDDNNGQIKLIPPTVIFVYLYIY